MISPPRSVEFVRRTVLAFHAHGLVNVSRIDNKKKKKENKEKTI